VELEMAGSVGIGGLIIGVSLLVVFSMAVQTMSYQMESSMDSIEAAAEPLPSFTVDSSDIWLFALEDITITDGGTDYVNGTLVASSCTGFSASFTVDINGVIDAVSITSTGDCLTSTPVISFGTPAQTPTLTATLTPVMKTYVFAVLTNDGTVTLPTEEVWLFLDGANPQTLSVSNPVGLSSGYWYSGETLDLRWELSPASHTRLAFTYDGTTVGTTL
jgi:hypothetical protein